MIHSSDIKRVRRRCRHIFSAVVFGWTIIVCCPAQDVSPEVLILFHAARADQQAGRLEEAAANYEKVVHLRPDLPEAYANLGLVYYAQARFADSVHALAKADRLKPGLLLVNLWLGVDLVNLNQPEKALAYLRKATSIAPHDQQAQRWLGTALWNADQRFAALDQFRHAHELFPEDSDILFVLGEAYRKAADKEFDLLFSQGSGSPLLNQIYGDRYREAGDEAKAIAQYNLALHKDDHWQAAYVGLGEAYLRQRAFSQAEKAFQAASELNPPSASAFAGLAMVAMGAARYQAAVQFLDRAVALSPAEAAAVLGIPTTSSIIGSNSSPFDQEQLRQAQGAAEHFPDGASRSLALAFVDANLNLPQMDGDWRAFLEATAQTPGKPGEIETSRNEYYARNYTAAAISLRSWLEDHPRDLPAHYLLALSWRGLALQTLDQLLRQNAHSARAHQLLAQIDESRGENEKALVEIRKVVELNPLLPGAHYELAHLLWSAGDADAALAALNQELAINPNNPEANGEMGSILVEQHDPAKAVPYLRTALQTRADRAFLHQQLGKAYFLLKNYAESEQELRKAVVADHDGSAYYQLGVLYRAEGQTRNASEAFAKSEAIKAERLSDIKLVPEKAPAQ